MQPVPHTAPDETTKLSPTSPHDSISPAATNSMNRDEISMPAVEQVESDQKGTIELEETVIVSELIHKPTKWSSFGFFYQFTVLSLAWVLFGYDVGIVGSLIGLPYFINHFQGPLPGGIMAFTPHNINLTVTVAIVGSTLSPLIAPTLQNKFGRKKTILIAYGFFCAPASLLQLLAPNIGALAAGRFFNFAGVTLAEQAVIPYINEIVPAKYRGTAVSLSGAFNGVAMILGTCIMYACSMIDSDMQWRIPLIIQTVLPAALFLATLTLKESVAWLLKNDRVEEATVVQAGIRRAGRDDMVQAEIAAMLYAIKEERNLKGQARFLDIFNRKNLRRTIGASLMGCLTACSGLGLTTTYGVVILQSVGVADPFKWQVLNSVLAFIGLIVGGFLNDRIGRRPLALIGLSVVAIFDFAAGGLATTGLTTYDQGISLAAISIVLSFFCQVGFAGVYLLVSECPNMVLREYTIAYSVWVNLASTIISSVALPYILGAPANLGPKAYMICGGFIVAGIIAVFFLIPETKNRTWAEIDEMYEAGVPCWRMSSFKGSAIEKVTETNRDLKAEAGNRERAQPA